MHAHLSFPVRSQASIPVPEVYAWSSDPVNPVGAEYIIMEKVKGAALAEIWGSMNALERYKIIDQIVQMEKQLERLKLPAYGNLFLRESFPYEHRHYLLPRELDPTESFCIGPSCSRNMHHMHHGVFQSNAGPCKFFSSHT